MVGDVEIGVGLDLPETALLQLFDDRTPKAIVTQLISSAGVCGRDVGEGLDGIEIEVMGVVDGDLLGDRWDGDHREDKKKGG